MSKLKSYPHWLFTTVVGVGTLFIGGGSLAAGLQTLEQPQPVMQAISLGVGILLLLANPVLYLVYRKQGTR